MLKVIKSYIWVILWTAVVIYLVCAPGEEFEKVPSYPGMDKIVHMGMFFIFSTLSYNGTLNYFGLRTTRWVPIIVVSIIGFIFALITEALQYYIFTYRSGDWWDIFADTVGIGMSGFAYLLYFRNKK